MESPEQRKHHKNYDAELTNKKPELFSSFDQLISANTENHKQEELLPEEPAQQMSQLEKNEEEVERRSESLR